MSMTKGGGDVGGGLATGKKNAYNWGKRNSQMLIIADKEARGGANSNFLNLNLFA